MLRVANIVPRGSSGITNIFFYSLSQELSSFMSFQFLHGILDFSSGSQITGVTISRTMPIRVFVVIHLKVSVPFSCDPHF